MQREKGFLKRSLMSDKFLCLKKERLSTGTLPSKVDASLPPVVHPQENSSCYAGASTRETQRNGRRWYYCERG